MSGKTPRCRLLAFDANAVLPIKTTKRRFLESNLNTKDKVAAEVETKAVSAVGVVKCSVIGQLEEEAAVVKPPTFRFSTEQVKWIREGDGYTVRTFLLGT